MVRTNKHPLHHLKVQPRQRYECRCKFTLTTAVVQTVKLLFFVCACEPRYESKYYEYIDTFGQQPTPTSSFLTASRCVGQPRIISSPDVASVESSCGMELQEQQNFTVQGRNELGAIRVTGDDYRQDRQQTDSGLILVTKNIRHTT